jgi:hypothetical protein
MNLYQHPYLGNATIHRLKCHPEPFAATRWGAKPFEWRKNDRDYKVHDVIILQEWNPNINTGTYTGNEIFRVITYVLSSGFDLPDGYCVLGLGEL